MLNPILPLWYYAFMYLCIQIPSIMPRPGRVEEVGLGPAVVRWHFTEGAGPTEIHEHILVEHGLCVTVESIRNFLGRVPRTQKIAAKTRRVLNLLKEV